MVSNPDFISDSVLIGLSGHYKIFYTDIREDNKHINYHSISEYQKSCSCCEDDAEREIKCWKYWQIGDEG